MRSLVSLVEPLKPLAKKVLRPGNVPIVEYARHKPSVIKTWRTINERKLTYRSRVQLAALLQKIDELEKRNDPGDIIEAGCALGGSAILMCSAKAASRRMRVYDMFGMIPPPSEQDGPEMHARYAVIESGGSDGLAGGRYYLYEDDLEATVRDNFAQLGYPIELNNVSLIAGKVQDTLEIDGPVAFAHIDVDWYEPITACLERIVPALSPQGSVVLCAYSDWSGCRTATDDYFGTRGWHGYRKTLVGGQLVITRDR